MLTDNHNIKIYVRNHLLLTLIDNAIPCGPNQDNHVLHVGMLLYKTRKIRKNYLPID